MKAAAVWTLLLLASLCACSSDNAGGPDKVKSSQSADAADSFEGVRWLPQTQIQSEGTQEAFVRFTEGEWTASDGCNGSSGVYEVRGDESVVLRSRGTTLLLCKGSWSSENVLEATSRLTVHGDTMKAIGSQGETLLTFHADKD
jgi:heat shock protein HslJ